MKKIYGYARISTKGQHLDRQFKALLNAGVAERDIITAFQNEKSLKRCSGVKQFIRNDGSSDDEKAETISKAFQDVLKKQNHLPESGKWFVQFYLFTRKK